MDNNNKIVALQYNGISIYQRESDGWINLSRLCKDNGKRFGNYLRLKQSQDEMGDLVNQLGSESIDSILQIDDGRYGGTWGHPLLAEKIIKWLIQCRSKQESKHFEKVHQNILATLLDAKVEVITKTGRVDILTDTEIIEVKDVKDWKFAIGQVLVYQLEFSDRQARIHLYGDCSMDFKQMIISYSARLNVLATFSDSE